MRSMTQRWTIVGGIAVAAMAILLVGCGSSDKKVPDVEGVAIQKALEQVQDAGFEVAVAAVSASGKPGTVTKQEPEAGASAEEGSTVTLTASLGPSEVAVPKVTELESQAAQDKLFAAGFQATVKEVPSTATVGTVTSQAPPPGEVAATNSKVQINVSSGPGTATVPKVVGQTADKAISAVQAAGLLAYVKPVASAEQAGNVVGQAPPTGETVDAGSVVQLNVSRGEGDVNVPSLVGLPGASAEAQLDQIGLVANVVSVPSSEPKGTVVSQNPNPGVSLAIGESVRINISEGK